MLRKLQLDYARLGELPFEHEFVWSDTDITPVFGLAIKHTDKIYGICLEFPADYPFKAPKITFLNPIQHPDVNPQGRVCMDDFCAWMNLRHFLLHLYCIIDDSQRNRSCGITESQHEPKDIFNAMTA